MEFRCWLSNQREEISSLESNRNETMEENVSRDHINSIKIDFLLALESSAIHCCVWKEMEREKVRRTLYNIVATSRSYFKLLEVK